MRLHKVKCTLLRFCVHKNFLRWSSNGSLTVYEVSCSDTSGPVVCKAIKLNSDFTWSATYRGYIVPNYSVLLKKFPPLINTGKTVVCLKMMSVPTTVCRSD